MSNTIKAASDAIDHYLWLCKHFKEPVVYKRADRGCLVEDCYGSHAELLASKLVDEQDKIEQQAIELKDALAAEDTLLSYSKKLEVKIEQHRWIPVSEKWPEKVGYYQCFRHDNRFPTTREYLGNGDWVSGDTVTHWKPIILPEAKERLKP